jgi:predicted small secreted protein
MLRPRKNGMKKTPLIAAASLAALLTLTACEAETVTADGAPDPQAEALKKAAPVEAPPMIQASRTFRCKDNSLVYADYYTNNTARVRTEKEGTPTVLTAANGQPPYTAEGWSLSANAAQVSLTAPGKGTQSCKA